MGFPNIPDNEIEVIQNHVAEIFIITDMGGLQHFQMGVVFARAIPFNDFMPDGIDKGVEVLNLHGGNPIHINLNIRKKLDKVLMGGKFAQQTVVNPTAFQKCYHLITQMQLPYAAAARAARAMGYQRIITYTLDTEGGVSLRAAGWHCAGRAGGTAWTGARAPKAGQYPAQMKLRYEKAL